MRTKPWDDAPAALKDEIKRMVEALRTLDVNRIQVKEASMSVDARGHKQQKISFRAITKMGVYEIEVEELRRVADFILEEKASKWEEKKEKKREDKKLEFIKELEKI